jgi:hypothetical protein
MKKKETSVIRELSAEKKRPKDKQLEELKQRNYTGEGFRKPTRNSKRVPPRQTLEGWFSAVSTPLIARVGAFFSIFEIYKSCILLHRSKLRKLTKVRRCLVIFATNFSKSAIF